MGDSTRCAMCGAELTADRNAAYINDDAYCHPDWEPSCYVTAQIEHGMVSGPYDADAFLALFEVD